MDRIEQLIRQLGQPRTITKTVRRGPNGEQVTTFEQAGVAFETAPEPEPEDTSLKGHLARSRSAFQADLDDRLKATRAELDGRLSATREANARRLEAIRNGKLVLQP